MGALCSVIRSLVIYVFCSQPQTLKRDMVRSELVRHDPAWRVTLLFEQLPYELYRCLGIASSLNEEVQNFSLIVDRTP